MQPDKVETTDRVFEYRKKGYAYLDELDGYLAEKTGSSAMAYIRFFERPKVTECYVPHLTELAYAYIFAVISVEEIKRQESPLFILNGNSVKELIILLKQIEFRLWEVEFSCGEDAEQRLYEYIRIYQITPAAMKNIIAIAGMHKKECYMKTADIYLNHGENDRAIQMLECGLEMFEEDTEFLNALVKLCRRSGQQEKQEIYEERLGKRADANE